MKTYLVRFMHGHIATIKAESAKQAIARNGLYNPDNPHLTAMTAEEEAEAAVMAAVVPEIAPQAAPPAPVAADLAPPAPEPPPATPEAQAAPRGHQKGRH